MNPAKLKTYPMQTTPATPKYVRPPTTLFEHFRADPRGAESFPEWIEKHRPASLWTLVRGGASFNEHERQPLSECLRLIDEYAKDDKLIRARVIDCFGETVKEWMIS